MQVLDFLASLEPADVEWLMGQAQSVTVLSKALLIREGVPLEAIYFVTEGLFGVELTGLGGKPVRIDRCVPGEIVGEMSWLDGHPASATIRADESSAVLALSHRVLDAQMERDPRFAARFQRGISLVVAGRLRGAHERTRARDLEREEICPESVAGAGRRLLEGLAGFKGLLAAADEKALRIKGPIPDELQASIRRRFRESIQGLNELIGDASTLPKSEREALGAIAKRELLPYIQLTATAERFYSKPRGYAGDYLTIDMMYENRPGGVGRIGPLLDACFLDEPSVRAVGNRRKLLAAEILATPPASGAQVIRVTCLACGPAREVFDAYEAWNRPEPLVVTGVDIDREAIALLATRSAERGLAESVTGVAGNLIYLATGRQVLDLPPQDLVYSTGLIDYFNDEFVVKLLDWIHERLRPGGRVILGNFHSRNPDKAFMDYILDWPLIHRDEAKMDALFQKSRFARPSSRILFEAEGVNLFAECVRA